MSTTPSPPLSWTPPALSDFNFSRNCTLAAQWAAADKIQILPTIWFIRQSLPENFTPAPTDFQIIEWFTSNAIYGNETVYGAMRDTAVRNCRFETCEALDWEGIADLAGVGMVITYFLEAIITTLLFLTLAVDYQVHRHPSRYHKTHMSPTSTPATHLLLLRRISAAMLGCLDEFLNSSIVFALSMLAAAIFENAYNVLTRGAETTLYATLLTMLLPIFTLFPVAILQATARGTLRRPKLRAAVWALMILLTAVLLGLAMTSFRILTSDDEEDGVKQSFYTSRSAQQNFERWCAPSESELAIRPAIYAGVGTFALTFSVWFTAIRDFRLIPHLRGNKVLRATRRVWWLVVACLGFIGMWTYLVLFTRYRSLIVQRAGYSQQDTRWSFGQVLALATWAPVLVDFLYILIFGPKEGLEGRISKKWDLVPRPDTPKHGGGGNGNGTTPLIEQDKIPLVGDVDVAFPSPDFRYSRASPREDAFLVPQRYQFSA